MPDKLNDKPPDETGLLCPDCNKEMENKCDTHSFRYGTGDTAIDVAVEVPTMYCAECDLGFLEAQGQELAHEALCSRLGVLSPRQIRAMRAQFRMSREQFATKTGFEEAILRRWERGESIPSHANDSYLRSVQESWVLADPPRDGTDA